MNNDDASVNKLIAAFLSCWDVTLLSYTIICSISLRQAFSYLSFWIWVKKFTDYSLLNYSYRVKIWVKKFKWT